jgi:hypothetical protein
MPQVEVQECDHPSADVLAAKVSSDCIGGAVEIDFD